MFKVTQSLEDRFMGKVIMIPESTCWYWSGGIDRYGYGQIKVSKRTRAAHRIAYELFNGPIPDGLQIDHICRTRDCVNPRHLEAVTARENTLRSPVAPASINSRMTHCKRGHRLSGDNLVPSLLRLQRRCLICSRMVQRERARLYRQLITKRLNGNG
jgi:hypothetical protein